MCGSRYKRGNDTRVASLQSFLKSASSKTSLIVARSHTHQSTQSRYTQRFVERKKSDRHKSSSLKLLAHQKRRGESKKAVRKLLISLNSMAELFKALLTRPFICRSLTVSHPGRLVVVVVVADVGDGGEVAVHGCPFKALGVFLCRVFGQGGDAGPVWSLRCKAKLGFR